MVQAKGVRLEVAVVDRGVHRVVLEIECHSSEHSRGGQHHAETQQHAHRPLHPRVIEQESHHIFPNQPFTIISMPSARTTNEKTVRSTETLARASSFAPITAPERTPSITGAASPGST